jgi:hypothetical protein
VTANLEDDLARIVALTERPVDNPHELASVLRQIYHAVFDVDLARYDPAAAKGQAPRLMRKIFLARVGLRDRIADWQSRGFMTHTVQRTLRDVFRISRYGTDMLGEIGIGHKRLADGEKTRRAFTGKDHNTLVHPRYDTGANIPFKSGDVLLVRGTGHNSAAIARIGDTDSQFSHVAMIYIDQEGKHWVVEALIEEGAVINTLEHVLEHDLGRAVLFRHKDAALAARAAEIIHARVLATKTGAARHIPYDFSMRLGGRRKLFCAKLVQQAFLDASGGKVVLPAFKTRFDQRNRRFLRAIGVKAKETFAPGDLDLDPQFDLVAEWQDYRVTSALRRQDMIMTKFFEWMEERGWRFRETPLIVLVSILGRFSSYLSEEAKNLIASVVPKVPRNMSRSCIATIAMLNKSAEALLPPLKNLEEDEVRMTGRALHPRDMLAHLERLRMTSGGRIEYLAGPV